MHANSPYRGWHDASDAALKSEQQLFFLFYQKDKTPLTPHNNCKKPKVKKQKSPLSLGKKS